MKLETESGVKKLKYYSGEDPLKTALAFCKKYRVGGSGDALRTFADALAGHIRDNLE